MKTQWGEGQEAQRAQDVQRSWTPLSPAPPLLARSMTNISLAPASSVSLGLILCLSLKALLPIPSTTQQKREGGYGYTSQGCERPHLAQIHKLG